MEIMWNYVRDKEAKKKKKIYIMSRGQGIRSLREKMTFVTRCEAIWGSKFYGYLDKI